jgi:peptide/nickel transport system substrate-binding protein
VATALVGASALAACTSPVTGGAAPSVSHGRLTVLALGPVDTWDPQRISAPQDIAFAGRTFLRTLTAFPSGGDGASQHKVVGDLATDAGTPDASMKTWRFTLRKGITWQDGSAITCADVQYGISRSFAAPFSTEGLNYPLAYLDIPRKADGTSTFAGPTDAAATAAFDKAVACSGDTVTFHLTTAMTDFNQALALPVFAPFKKSQDRGKAGTYAVFASGPYQLKGLWDASSGGTFVRNPRWDKASDPIREAQPVAISYVEGTESQTAVQQVIDGRGERAASVSLDSAPPAVQQHLLSDPALSARVLNPTGQFVDYLAPNLVSGVMKNADVRTAFALATNKDGYVTALGGPSTATPTNTLIGPALPGHRSDDPLGVGSSGDAAAARAMLRKSGLTLPVTVRVAYRSTPTSDKAMAALSSGWTDAGFTVQLQPVAKSYFQTVSQPGRTATTDVFWANWAPAWPSASTVIPSLFDSRINLTSSGKGLDLGGFQDDKVNAEITRILAMHDASAQANGWADLDASLAKRVAFVGLAQRRSLYVAGSAVSGLLANEAMGGFVDLATIEVR